MEVPAGGLNYSQITMGLFALYVVIVSLLRIMAEKEYFRLTAMKRIWGRTVGLVMHFVSSVALPLVCGVVFLSSGIAGFGVGDELRRSDPVIKKYVQRHLAGGAGQSIAEGSGPHHVEFDPFFRAAP